MPVETTTETGSPGVLRRAGGSLALARNAAVLMAGWVALLWLLEVIDVASGNSLDHYGITPRDVSDLPDVLSAPFIHFGFAHVAANSIPLFVLGFAAATRGIGRFLGLTLLIIVLDGLGVWLISPSHTVTAGASGVIFGFFGYLVVRGFVDRKPLDILLGALVAVVYGSILWGLLPNTHHISWQAHVCGLIAGVIGAFVLRDRGGRRSEAVD